MPLPDPQPGLVIRYAYLWRSEEGLGRREGSKDRPCAVILTVRRDSGRLVVAVAPVTHAKPRDPAAAIPMPAAVKDQDLAEIREALFKVPEKYREPLVMQVLMGFSTSEIAAALEVSRAAVLVRLFRGRQQLRAFCGEDIDSDPPASADHRSDSA